MKKDSQTIFSNRRTLHERNQIRKRMVAHILRANFKKEFKACRILVGDQFFIVDLMSEDDEIKNSELPEAAPLMKKLSPAKALSSILNPPFSNVKLFFKT